MHWSLQAGSNGCSWSLNTNDVKSVTDVRRMKRRGHGNWKCNYAVSSRSSARRYAFPWVTVVATL